LHELYLLFLQQRPQLNCKGHEVIVGEQVLPKLTPFGVIAETPQMDQLV
tara:strand:- start:26565 stop:26711 length:147 start_codon:yes stop_codon:yes gene_type:complete